MNLFLTFGSVLLAVINLMCSCFEKYYYITYFPLYVIYIIILLMLLLICHCTHGHLFTVIKNVLVYKLSILIILNMKTHFSPFFLFTSCRTSGRHLTQVLSVATLLPFLQSLIVSLGERRLFLAGEYESGTRWSKFP